MIFKIMDRYRKRALSAAEVVITINGRRRTPLVKPGGYFVFTDLEPGPAAVEFLSPVFERESVAVDIPRAGDGYTLWHLMLNPSRAYPFGGPVTTVSGRLLLERVPLAGIRFHLIPGDGAEVLKIAEDGAEAGKNRLKLFAAVSGRRLSLPGRYLIKDREEARREVCLIAESAGPDGQYPLDAGMAFSHPRGTPLVEVIECVTARDGSFFTAVPETGGGRQSLDLLVQTGQGGRFRKRIDLEVLTENKLDTLEVG